MCHSLGPLARGPPFIQLAFYSNTSSPPPVLWDQAQLRQGHKSPTQNSIQSSRPSDWKGSTDAGWRKTSYLPKQTEKARERVSPEWVELARNPPEGTRRNFLRERSPRAVGREPGTPAGAGAGSALGRVSAPPPESRGLELPAAARAGALPPSSLSGAAGCSWPQRWPRLRPSRAGLARFHVPGPGLLLCSPPPPGSRCWDEPRAPGEGSRGPRWQGPGSLSAAGCSPSLWGPDSSAVARGGGSSPTLPARGGRCPSGPAWKPWSGRRRRRRRLLPAQGRLAGFWRPSRERAQTAEEAGGGGGRATAGARAGSGSGSGFPALAASGASSRFPSPADFFGPLPSDFGKPPHPGSLRRSELRSRPWKDASAGALFGGAEK